MTNDQIFEGNFAELCRVSNQRARQSPTLSIKFAPMKFKNDPYTI